MFDLHLRGAQSKRCEEAMGVGGRRETGQQGDNRGGCGKGHRVEG